MICEAIRTRPKQINTRLGTFGEVSYALFPKAVDQILSTAYKVFPDSAASRGEKDPDEHASTEQVALAHLMRGDPLVITSRVDSAAGRKTLLAVAFCARTGHSGLLHAPAESRTPSRMPPRPITSGAPNRSDTARRIVIPAGSSRTRSMSSANRTATSAAHV